MSKNKINGYKVCFSEKTHKKRLHNFFITKSIKQAKHVKAYSTRYISKYLNKPTWYINPITKSEIKDGIWREAPY